MFVNRQKIIKTKLSKSHISHKNLAGQKVLHNFLFHIKNAAVITGFSTNRVLNKKMAMLLFIDELSNMIEKELLLMNLHQTCYRYGCSFITF